ncbi:hypothetical protein AB0I81_40265 [Nonomuraea sp. NPDC050404]|uniref:hypothetical protein n=1 Tax=Nonomuraea sp. NPDC050404 TaxID=3155783 RepID=UPI00340CBE51
MPAEVRSVAATPLSITEEEDVERGEAQPGDLILAFHSSDWGSLNSMSISGGGTWQPLGSRAGSDWAGSEIWAKPVTSGEPTHYRVRQEDEDTDGTVILLVLRLATLSNVVVQSANGFVAPAASPGFASGVEIRYAAASPYDDDVTWPQLSGYNGLDVITLGGTVTATLAVRSYVTNAQVPALNLAPDPNNFTGHAFTILVRSTGSGGGTPPTPPEFPATMPGRGETTMRYTVHDFLTGQYLADIRPSDVRLSQYINEPGSWSGRLNLANPREADRINRLFPADADDLTSGPGRLLIHTWRSGVLWGPHWIHTTETGRDERGRVYMDLRGSTLDGYLNYVAIEDDTDLVFGDDQIQNARDLLLHMMANPSSNPGFGLMAGSSGVFRLLEAKADGSARYGQVLQAFAKASDGFEYTVNGRVVDGSIIRSWEWGSPKIIKSAVHTFVEAAEGRGTITNWREVRSALSGGNRWGSFGGTPEQEDATMTATAVRAALIVTPHVAAGWPLIDQRPVHPSASTDQDEVDRYAAYWAATAPGAPSVFTFDAILGAKATLGPTSLGEQVRAILNNARYPIRSDGSASFDRRMRLIGYELTPGQRGSGKDRIKCVTESQVAA